MLVQVDNLVRVVEISDTSADACPPGCGIMRCFILRGSSSLTGRRGLSYAAKHCASVNRVSRQETGLGASVFKYLAVVDA